jgi:hypothetical protein
MGINKSLTDINVETAAEAAQFLFWEIICFKFSVLCLSVQNCEIYVQYVEQIRSVFNSDHSIPLIERGCRQGA